MDEEYRKQLETKEDLIKTLQDYLKHKYNKLETIKDSLKLKD